MTDWQDNRWMLPDGVEEALPEQAARLEALRRQMIDLYTAWGYDLIDPPYVESLDALLTGAGEGLKQQTLKLVDPQDGSLLGIRADMTPQAARIDAHRLQRSGTSRLCYLGSVFKAAKSHRGACRNPIQLGAEIFGSDSLEADIESASLMLEMLLNAGIADIHLDLGHVGVYRELVKQVGWDTQSEATFFGYLQNKSRAEIESFLAEQEGLSTSQLSMLGSLIDLHGGSETLAVAREKLADAGEQVAREIKDLSAIGQRLGKAYPQVTINYDLAELRGYAYHTGVVFAALVDGEGKEVARGGRYDHIGESFGRSRPATGFSADLRTLSRLGEMGIAAQATAVLAPSDECLLLAAKISELRASGTRVVKNLDDAGQAADFGCNALLINQDNAWVVVPAE